VVDDVMQR